MIFWYSGFGIKRGHRANEGEDEIGQIKSVRSLIALLRSVID